MDERDHITLDHAKDALNIESDVVAHDDEIAAFITAASLRIDDLCGPVIQREVTEYHTGGGMIRPYLTPVASVTSVTEYASGTPTVLSAADHDTGPTDGFRVLTLSAMNTVIYRSSGWLDRPFAVGHQNVKLVYVAGRFASTDEVDGKWRTACALTVQHLWRPSAAGWQQTSTFGEPAVAQASPVAPWMLPRAVTQLLGHDLLPPGVA